jgi:LacI family transcriptional regulator
MNENKKRSTIRDVAEKAKVSISTVSHVLNDTRFVEEETRSRILSSIKELDYRPNQFARSLRGAGSRSLGLIISDIREDFFSEITKAIESAANQIGYAVFLCDSEADSEKERMYLDLLSEKGVEGIILAPVDSSQAPVRREEGGVPMVQVDRRCPGSGLDYVGIENAKLAAEAVAFLAARGNRRIAYLGHESSISTMEERARGYAEAMRGLGLYDEVLVNVTAARGKGESRAIREWIASVRGMDAILCGNANICFVALEALSDLTEGGFLAGKVDLATFDDLACFRFMDNPVASVRQPTERMGLAALEALMARIRGEAPNSPVETILPATLVPRGSRPTPERGAVATNGGSR